MKKDRSRESVGFPPPADADLREQAAAMADAAWIMSGFELSADPAETPTEEPTTPPSKSSHTKDAAIGGR